MLNPILHPPSTKSTSAHAKVHTRENRSHDLQAKNWMVRGDHLSSSAEHHSIDDECRTRVDNVTMS